MRRRKFLLTLSVLIGAILIGVVFIAGKTASLAKEEKKAFDFNNAEAPHLMKAEGLPFYSFPTQASTTTVNATGLATKYFVQSLFKSVSENKTKLEDGQNAVDLSGDAQTIDKATEELMQSIAFQPLSISDLNLIASNSESALKRYFEEITGNLVKKETLPYELTYVFDQALREKNFEPAKETATYYDEMVHRYVSLDTPAGAAELHLWLTNNLKRTGWLFEMLADSKNDPIKGVIALNLFERIPLEEVEKLKEISGSE